MIKDISKLNHKEEKKLQDHLIETIDTEINASVSYTLLLICSTIIATLGLINGSTAVVIGAMIISPIIWPILGVTLSIITTRRHLIRKSALLLVFSILVVIIISFIVTVLVPTKTISPEVEARVNPTLIDLFIALASSVIGVAAIYHPKISSSAPGVAISISLLPPLAVAGIGIALGSLNIFLGSFLLFASNTGAMVFAGVITLYFLGLRPRYKNEKKILRIGFISSLIILIVLSIPLTIYLKKTINQEYLVKEIKVILNESISEISNESKLDKVLIMFPTENETDKLNVSATVYIPEGKTITSKNKDDILEKINSKLEKKVNLKLDVVNTLLIKNEQDQIKLRLLSNIKNTIKSNLLDINKSIVIESIDAQFNDSKYINIDEEISVLLRIKQFNNEPLTVSDKELIYKEIREISDYPIHFEVEFIPVRLLSEKSEEFILQETVEKVIKSYMTSINKNITIENISLENNESNNSFEISTRIFVPSEQEVTLEDQKGLEKLIEDSINMDTILYLQIINFDSVVLE